MWSSLGNQLRQHLQRFLRVVGQGETVGHGYLNFHRGRRNISIVLKGSRLIVTIKRKFHMQLPRDSMQLPRDSSQFYPQQDACKEQTIQFLSSLYVFCTCLYSCTYHVH